MTICRHATDNAVVRITMPGQYTQECLVCGASNLLVVEAPISIPLHPPEFGEDNENPLAGVRIRRLP